MPVVARLLRAWAGSLTPHDRLEPQMARRPGGPGIRSKTGHRPAGRSTGPRGPWPMGRLAHGTIHCALLDHLRARCQIRASRTRTCEGMRYEPGSGGAWINPDSRGALRVVVMVTAMLALVSFAVSFAGLVAVAEWAAIPRWLAWALPVFIDGAIIVYTIAMLVFRSRGHSTGFAWTALLAFTAVSVAANSAHAYAEGNTGDWQTWVGAGLAGLAPAGVAVAIHTIAMLTVRPPAAGGEVAQAPIAQTEHQEPANGWPGAGAEASSHSTMRQPEQAPSQPPAGAEADRPRQRPHESGRSTGANSDTDLVARAVTLREKGLSQKAIADELDRGKSTIGRWLREHDQQARTLRAVP